MNFKHGERVGGRFTPEYKCWNEMFRRCKDKSRTWFPRYGGRGINVCKRWESFEKFLADMGRKPTLLHTIERKNNDGHYEPGNCVWATRMEQANNRNTSRSILFDGLNLTIAEWSRKLGIPKDRISHRLTRGWSEIDALTKRKMTNKYG